MRPLAGKYADRFAALCLLLMAVFAIAGGARLPVPAWLAGIAGWTALVLLWRGLDLRQRQQSLMLMAIGLAALAWVGWRSGAFPWLGVLTNNTALLGMLVSVSFLQLLGLEESGTLPRGRAALWRTVAGVHALGAVINISAVFLMADRMAGGRNPTVTQASALTRGFLAAALWSPFFAATAVALTYAPGVSLGQLALAGLPLALVINVLAVRELLRRQGVAETFVGYPMHASALWVPLLLALMVLGGHAVWPHWTTLAIVSLAAPLMAAVIVTARGGVIAGSTQLARHVRYRLPVMRGELSLFLAAAVLATGLNALISTSGGWLPLDRVGPLEASLVLAGMIVLCVLGIHAVISITMVAAWLAPLEPDPLLMAMVYTQCWAIGLAAGPMSGIHLALQGRYGLSAVTLARQNGRYCLLAYAMAVLTLFGTAALRG